MIIFLYYFIEKISFKAVCGGEMLACSLVSICIRGFQIWIYKVKSAIKDNKALYTV